MSRHEFAYAAETTEATARFSKSPLPVLTSAAPELRQHERDMIIMEALLRECLKARDSVHPASTPRA